jgi:hypothetical protein
LITEPSATDLSACIKSKKFRKDPLASTQPNEDAPYRRGYDSTKHFDDGKSEYLSSCFGATKVEQNGQHSINRFSGQFGRLTLVVLDGSTGGRFVTFVNACTLVYFQRGRQWQCVPPEKAAADEKGGDEGNNLEDHVLWAVDRNSVGGHAMTVGMTGMVVVTILGIGLVCVFRGLGLVVCFVSTHFKFCSK